MSSRAARRFKKRPGSRFDAGTTHCAHQIRRPPCAEVCAALAAARRGCAAPAGDCVTPCSDVRSARHGIARRSSIACLGPVSMRGAVAQPWLQRHGMVQLRSDFSARQILAHVRSRRSPRVVVSGERHVAREMVFGRFKRGRPTSLAVRLIEYAPVGRSNIFVTPWLDRSGGRARRRFFDAALTPRIRSESIHHACGDRRQVCRRRKARRDEATWMLRPRGDGYVAEARAARE
jgi:hypothetical protein